MRRFLQVAALAVFGAAISPAASDITLASGVIVAPGEQATMPVTLAAPAPAGGVYVSLASADPSIVTINPSLIVIPGGATVPTRQPQLNGINFGAAAITATALGSPLSGDSQTVLVSASLTGVQNLALQLATTQNVTLVLTSPAPNYLTLNVSTDNPAIAGVPASVFIPANQNAVYIPVTGTGAGSTIIHISSQPAVARKDIGVTVSAPGVITLPSGMAIPLGTTAPFPVTLGTPAPVYGSTVSLSSSDVSKMTVSPSSVYIPAGMTAPATQPQVTAVDLGGATITASTPGYVNATAAVGVTATLTFSPTSLTIPATGLSRVTLALSASAPWGTGLTAQLTSSNTNVAIVSQSVNFYPDGSSVNAIAVLIQPVGPGTTTVTASAPPFIAPTSIVITVPGAGGGGVPSSVTATGGTPQTAMVNTPFGLPLSVTVTDTAGMPVAGATVQFQAPATGATGAFASAINSVSTNAAGVATSGTFTANGVPGSYQVSATVAGVPTPAYFSLTNSQTPSGTVVLPANVTLGPGQQVSYPVSLSVAALSGGAVISLSSGDSSKATISPSTVFVPAGATAPAIQPLITGVDFGNVTISGSAAGYASASQIAKVAGALAFQPTVLTIHGTGSQSLNLTLSAPAPGSGLVATLSSNNPAVASVGSSITIPAGASAAAVLVTGGAAGSATITAHSTGPNVTDGTATVTVSPGSDIMLSSGVIVAPGEQVTMPVTLAAPAPAGGVYVNLTSANPSIVTINPSLIVIQGGATVPARQPQVSGINFGSAAITATASGGSLSGDSQTVLVSASLTGIQSLQLQRATTQNVTLVLTNPAPSDLTLNVSSDNPAIASVPASAFIPANQNAVYIPVTGIGAGSTTIHVSSLPAVARKDIGVTVSAPGAITLPSGMAIPLGTTAPFPVTLGTPAPFYGSTVSLSSSDVSKMTVSPSSVYIPAGMTSPATQPQVTAVDLGGATITASAPGYVSASAAVGVTATLTFSPASLTIPATGLSRVTLALSASAPWGTGLTAQLTSSNPNVAIVSPSVNFYPDGSSVNAIAVMIQPMGPGTTTITASAPPFIAPTTIVITVPGP
jgi:hypothetical protein